jgi:hypothetical protein
MNPLIIGAGQRFALQRLRDKAASDPLHMPDVVERLKTEDGRRAHRERMNGQTITLPLAYFVTLSIETGHPAGPCRHMSMSSGRHGKLPTPEAIWMVCQELGFVASIEQCATWVEDLSDGGKAVNVVQPIALATTGTA